MSDQLIKFEEKTVLQVFTEKTDLTLISKKSKKKLKSMFLIQKTPQRDRKQFLFPEK